MAITHEFVGKLGGGLDWVAWPHSNFRALGFVVLKVTAQNRTTLIFQATNAVSTKVVNGTDYFLLRKGDSVDGLQKAQTVEYLKLD